jgi:hypothetical protein
MSLSRCIRTAIEGAALSIAVVMTLPSVAWARADPDPIPNQVIPPPPDPVSTGHASLLPGAAVVAILVVVAFVLAREFANIRRRRGGGKVHAAPRPSVQSDISS